MPLQPPAPVTGTPSPGYIDPLLIMRGLCAVGVVVVHVSGRVPDGWRLYDALQQSAGFWSRLILAFWPLTGQNFVFAFFILSGYLMGKLFRSGKYRLSYGGVRKFYVNRVRRLAPLLYVNLLVCLAISGDWTIVISKWKDVFGDFLFLNNFTHKVINPVTWSLSYEMQDYFICPLFALLLPGRSGRTVRWALLALACLMVYSFASQAVLTDWSLQARLLGLARYTWLFFSGYLLNLLIEREREKAREWSRRASWWWGGAAFLAANGLYYLLDNLGSASAAQIVMLLFILVSIFFLELPRPFPPPSRLTARLVTGRALTGVGMVSYGIYLWHWPITTAFTTVPPAVSSAAGAAARAGVPAALTVTSWCLMLTLLLTLTVSVITFFAVELRFRPNLYTFSESRILARLLLRERSQR